MENGRLTVSGRTAFALDPGAVDKLLGLRNGDAALLYLYLLRTGGDLPGAARQLGWEQTQLERALQLLQGAQLIDGAPAEAGVQPSAAEELPSYAAAEVTDALGADPLLAGLMDDVQQRLGRMLSTDQMKTVYGLYDYLKLPPEVIALLVTYCIEERRGPDGTGPMPTLRQIEREGFRWRRAQVDSPERAEEHLKRLLSRRTRRGELLSALGIAGRKPVASEQKYLDDWMEWGFGADAVAIAYDRTVLKTGGLKWAYLNSILKSWHEKGLHTPAEIEAGDKPFLQQKSGQAAGRPGPAKGTDADRAAIEWMRDYMKTKKGGGGHGL